MSNELAYILDKGVCYLYENINGVLHEATKPAPNVIAYPYAGLAGVKAKATPKFGVRGPDAFEVIGPFEWYLEGNVYTKRAVPVTKILFSENEWSAEFLTFVDGFYYLVIESKLVRSGLHTQIEKNLITYIYDINPSN